MFHRLWLHTRGWLSEHTGGRRLVVAMPAHKAATVVVVVVIGFIYFYPWFSSKAATPSTNTTPFTKETELERRKKMKEDLEEQRREASEVTALHEQVKGYEDASQKLQAQVA